MTGDETIRYWYLQREIEKQEKTIQEQSKVIAESEVSYRDVKQNLDLALHTIKEQDKEIAELRSSRDSLSTMAKVYLERITALEAAINEAVETQDD
jgi:chromosome segregation ATPase